MEKDIGVVSYRCGLQGCVPVFVCMFVCVVCVGGEGGRGGRECAVGNLKKRTM